MSRHPRLRSQRRTKNFDIRTTCEQHIEGRLIGASLMVIGAILISIG